jgi:uncharacterized protein
VRQMACGASLPSWRLLRRWPETSSREYGALPAGIGPEDQRPAEARSDVLVFSTPAFTQSTEVTGPISLALFVSSSAVDTDFTGKVVDVWPNGFAQNLTEGILRLRYRNSQKKPELGNPGIL